MPTVYDELRRIAAAKMAGERRDEALADLEKEAPQVAELVKLRYFVGMTMPQAAEAMELPLCTAERLWSFGKVYLKTRIGDREKHS